MDSSRVLPILSWLLAILLAAMFIMAGLGKLTGAATEMFATWGYPAWFATLIGVAEVLGGIGLLIPKTSKWAVLGLVGVMLGAVYTHLANGEGAQVLRPIIFLVVLGTFWYLRRER